MILLNQNKSLSKGSLKLSFLIRQLPKCAASQFFSKYVCYVVSIGTKLQDEKAWLLRKNKLSQKKEKTFYVTWCVMINDEQGRQFNANAYFCIVVRSCNANIVILIIWIVLKNLREAIPFHAQIQTTFSEISKTLNQT